MAVTTYEFGDFKLDCDRFELYRAGRSVKLERKPMELLVLLAAKNGHLVTRTEIAEHLWDREVFVDTEHGINTAIRKIREALQDDPGQSRFVQTVTGKGYRFVEARASSTSEVRVPSPEISPAAVAIPDSPVNDAATVIPFESQPSRSSHRRIWLAASVVLACFAVGLGIRGLLVRSPGGAGGSKIASLAVLPLDNLTGDPAQDYLADGMTDELITMLAKNSTTRVISRTSVLQYKGVHRPLREIARELRVDGVLEGSVSRSGDKLHMNLQLIQSSNDAHLWAESYDRDPNDLISLPREAARTIANRLGSAVHQSAPVRFVRPEAHDAYLRGRYLWFLAKNDEAGTYFRKATELQPDYALGWSGLSVYYGAGTIEGTLDPQEALAPQDMTARKAVELDDSLPEAHLALGAAIFLHQWDWVRSDQEIGRSIELNPNFAEAYHFRAKMYAALNRNQEAIEAEKKAAELDPFQRPWAVALSYLLARQYDEALTEAVQKLESNPQDRTLLGILAEIYLRQGKQKDATEAMERRFLLGSNPASAADVRRAFERGGYPAVVRWQLSQAKANASSRYISPVSLARLNAQLGRREETLALLDEGYRQHSPLLLWVQNDPTFDFLHSDERYRSIIQKTGLPPAY